MRLYGNIFYNRLSPGLSEEELFYSNLDLTGKTVIDAGAHIGIHAYLFAKTAKKVLAFEPNPQSFGFLERNVRLNGLKNVALTQAGLSDAIGKAEYVADKFVSAKGTFKKNSQAIIKEKSNHIVIADARLTTVDEVRKSAGRIDFIKIDTEGHEPGVIGGMRETIKIDRPDIYFEIHGATQELKEADFEMIRGQLVPSGYAVHKLKSGMRNVTDGDPETSGGYVAFAEPRDYLEKALLPFR